MSENERACWVYGCKSQFLVMGLMAKKIQCASLKEAEQAKGKHDRIYQLDTALLNSYSSGMGFYPYSRIDRREHGTK